ncbi:flavin reductase [Tichowtungia aerotolerans]|uniref:Flavin reductase family protein n=1 Tax=Tichowtungia aerotolerans TaxID=2697043 RepID=A0A6P1MFM9_9BACT|nr:flavin reductase [Tichowtungia aerotolerans]QHI70416.1 flavin reductase family protein [Tichowtungia aerotolerans]
MKNFTEIDVLKLNESPFRMIGKEWMLVTAGSMAQWNTMTASWGAMGELWFKPVVFTFFRPQRYTLEFVELEEFFTLSFFDEKHRTALNFCGSNSGRDCDKAEKTGLTPVSTPNGSVAFGEARLVLECRKMYFQDLDPSHFLDPEISKCYPKEDYHRMFVGEVMTALQHT